MFSVQHGGCKAPQPSAAKVLAHGRAKQWAGTVSSQALQPQCFSDLGGGGRGNGGGGLGLHKQRRQNRNRTAIHRHAVSTMARGTAS